MVHSWLNLFGSGLAVDLSPSVYEHAAFLIGRTPWEVSRDGELIFQAHAEAYRRYRQTPVMPGIDIYNLEAEAYGGVVEKPGGVGIPAICKPAFHSVDELAQLKPLDPSRSGRIPMIIDVARRLAREFPEAVIRTPVSGPFSIASNLVGFETLLCEVADRPRQAAAALMHLVDGQVEFAKELKAAGVDVAFFESAACPPLLSPRQFREVELPALKSDHAAHRRSRRSRHPLYHRRRHHAHRGRHAGDRTPAIWSAPSRRTNQPS